MRMDGATLGHLIAAGLQEWRRGGRESPDICLLCGAGGITLSAVYEDKPMRGSEVTLAMYTLCASCASRDDISSAVKRLVNVTTFTFIPDGEKPPEGPEGPEGKVTP